MCKIVARGEERGKQACKGACKRPGGGGLLCVLGRGGWGEPRGLERGGRVVRGAAGGGI